MASVGVPRPVEHDGAPGVVASVEIGGRPYEIRYGASRGPLAAGADPFLPALLLPAMQAGEPLRIAGAVSPRLLAGAARIQDIFHVWNRRYRKVPVAAAPETPQATGPAGRGVGCFFSGGVDSFYSLLEHADEITALVTVYGFDIPLAAGALRAQVATAVRAVARALGVALVEVETDLCAMAGAERVRWRLYQGGALASVALLLAPLFSRVIVPASHSYAQLFPWGTHPLVDPLWSTEEVELVHDGCEATRNEKVARVAGSPVALRWLRVCYENRDGAYNCGACEKCLRTMVALRAVGALDRCATFDRPLDLAAVARMDVEDVSARGFAEDNLRFVEARGGDPALTAALRASLRGGATGGA